MADLSYVGKPFLGLHIQSWQEAVRFLATKIPRRYPRLPRSGQASPLLPHHQACQEAARIARKFPICYIPGWKVFATAQSAPAKEQESFPVQGCQTATRFSRHCPLTSPIGKVSLPPPNHQACQGAGTFSRRSPITISEAANPGNVFPPLSTPLLASSGIVFPSLSNHHIHDSQPAAKFP